MEYNILYEKCIVTQYKVVPKAGATFLYSPVAVEVALLPALFAITKMWKSWNRSFDHAQDDTVKPFNSKIQKSCSVKKERTFLFSRKVLYL